MISDIKVGYSCNNDCLHCVIADNKRLIQANGLHIDLSTDECITLIKEAILQNANTIVLTGGEPTIRKDFHYLFNFCHDNGCKVQVQSNGRLFCNSEFCKQTNILQEDSFCIAIHGDNKELHDSITQRPGSFKETTIGLKNLVNYKANIIAKIVISKLNMPNLIGILILLNDLGIKRANFAFPHGVGNARLNFDKIVPKYLELQPILRELIETANEYNIYVDFEAIPFCIVKHNVTSVGELGFLNQEDRAFTPVMEKTQDWTEVRKSIKTKGASCCKCSLDLICEGPWHEYVDQYGYDELVPIPFNALTVSNLLSRVMHKQL